MYINMDMNEWFNIGPELSVLRPHLLFGRLQLEGALGVGLGVLEAVADHDVVECHTPVDRPNLGDAMHIIDVYNK